MKKKFDVDCAAERIVSKICLEWREYVVDEFIKIDWSFFDDGDKEKMLTDEEFLGTIWAMLYEKMKYFKDCYACDDYFYIVRLDNNTANVVARKLVRTAFKNTTNGTVYHYAEMYLFDDVLCITEEFIENVKKNQISVDDARKKTNFLFENKCSIYV